MISDVQARRKLNATPEEIDALVVTGLWETQDDGSYKIHDYLDNQLSHEEREKLSEIRAKAGAKGGRVSKKEQDCKQIAQQNNNFAKQSRVEKSREEETLPRERASLSESFKKLTTIYPRLDNLQSAKTVFEQLPESTDMAAVLEAAKRYAHTVRLENIPQRYIRSLSRWLSERDWEATLPSTGGDDSGLSESDLSDWVVEHPGVDSWAARRVVFGHGLSRAEAFERLEKLTQHAA